MEKGLKFFLEILKFVGNYQRFLSKMPRFIEEKISELEIGDWKEKGHKSIST
jgi:hypothetical protein